MAAQNLSSKNLPEQALLRLPQVLSLIPVGKSTFWRWCAEGKAPKPIKLGKKTTVWKSRDIAAYITELEKHGGVK